MGKVLVLVVKSFLHTMYRLIFQYIHLVHIRICFFEVTGRQAIEQSPLRLLMIELGHHIVIAKQHMRSVGSLYIDQPTRFATADNDVDHCAQAAVAITLSRILYEFYSYNIRRQEGCHFCRCRHNAIDTCLHVAAIGFQFFTKGVYLQMRNGKVQHQVIWIIGILHGSGGGYYNHAVYLLRDIATRHHYFIQ